MSTDATDPSSTQPQETLAGERYARGLRQTWELELVISGAVAFALLQIPSVVDRAFERLDPHLAGNLQDGVFLVYYYTKLALYTAIATFLIHLVARAYWVGLVGLEAVFPRGVQWEKLTYGPISRKFYEKRLPSLPVLIKKADNFCSSIFSFSFMTIFTFILSMFWAAVLGLIAFALSRLFFGGERLGSIFRILALALLLPLMLTSWVDKAVGAKLDPAGRPARFLRRLNGFYYRVLFMDLYAPILTVLISNIRKKAIHMLLAAAMIGVLGSFFVSTMMQEELLSLDSDIYVPGEPGEYEVSPGYYEDQRPEDKVFRTIPSIQSDVIQDSYIKLFIPYFPRRHNPALERRCPGVEPMREPGLRFSRPGESAPPSGAPRKVLRCLAEIHRVSLDGKPLPGLEFQFSTHPRTGVRGIAGYVSTAGLSPGSHLLRVEAVPRAEPRKNERPPAPYLIRFWL